MQQGCEGVLSHVKQYQGPLDYVMLDKFLADRQH